jgi:hypothetical protein
MRIALVAAELNNINIIVGDISSAYLEAYTQEKVCFRAGPELRPLEAIYFKLYVLFMASEHLVHDGMTV